MPRLANCRNRPVSLDPKSMSIADLQALPRKSLMLLASARNLITTGTKPLLAQHVFKHEHPPPTRNTNAGNNDRNSDTRETSEDQHGRNSQQTDQQTTNSTFSNDQLNQLRSLIAEAVVLQRLPSVPPAVPLLSPVSDHLPSDGQDGRQDETPRENCQDGGTGERGDGGDSRLEPRLPHIPQTLLANLPALEHNLHNPSLPPMPERLRTKILKREYVDFNNLLLDNMYPHPSHASSHQNFTLAYNPQDSTSLTFVLSQRKKRCIDGLSSWLEAWNVYFHTTLAQFPHLAPDLLAYQDQMCKFSRKFKALA